MKNEIAQVFKLDPTNEEWQAIRCPFPDHPDSSKSAGILLKDEPREIMFNCFGCMRKMNIVKAMEEMLEIKENEAMSTLVNQINDPDFKNLENDLSWLDDDSASWTPKPQKKVSPVKQVDIVAEFFQSRNIDSDTVDKFFVGYESDVAKEFYGYAQFKFEGVTVRRKMLDSVEGERYRNPKGAARKLIGDNFDQYDTLILVEGPTDFMALYSCGFHNCVASLGAQLSKEQAYLMRHKTVFILYDADFGGYEGAKRAKDLLKQYHATAVILEIPKWLHPDKTKGDPGICIESSPETFSRWLKGKLSKYKTFDTEFVTGLFNTSRNLKVYPTGLTELDEAMAGGLVRGVHAFTGLPGSGKSTLAIKIADTGVQAGAKVLILTYELAVEQYWSRLASVYSQHSWSEIERTPGIVEPEVAERMKDYSRSLRIDSNFTLEEVIIASRSFDIVIVDYIQRMPAPGIIDERTGIKINSKGLSDITRDDEKVVILLSSMPRSQYTGGESQAVFKETGDIEYIAQSGTVIKRQDDTLLMRMVKNTRGPLISYWMNVDFAHQRLTSLDTKQILESTERKGKEVDYEAIPL